MAPIGLLLIVIGGLLMRQIVAGRVPETMSDLRELANDAIVGDFDGVWETLTSTGTPETSVAITTTSDSAGSDTDSDGGSGTGSATASGNGLLSTAKELGSGARYVMGATGPNSYDCSGLVWKALQAENVYKGSRFTTATFNNVAPKFADKVSSPQVGDIANDASGRHMGIVSGKDMFYSAMNPTAGIGSAKISTFKVAGNQHFNPTYWRLKGREHG